MPKKFLMPPQKLSSGSLLSGDAQWVPSNTSSLGANVPMKAQKAKKPPKTQEELSVEVVETLEKSIAEGIKDREHYLRRKALENNLIERVRNDLVGRFGNGMSPGELDRAARDIARSASYTISEKIHLLPAHYFKTSIVGVDEPTTIEDTWVSEPDSLGDENEMVEVPG